MRYKIDILRLALLLLPPVLRSRLLKSYLNALLLPVRSLYAQFMDLKTAVDKKIAMSANVQYLEKLLNDAFALKEPLIYITTPIDDVPYPMWYLQEDSHDTVTMRNEAEEEPGLELVMNGGESLQIRNFVVHIPTFILSSLADKTNPNYRKIVNILNIYKPAGRTFDIELYYYE